MEVDAPNAAPLGAGLRLRAATLNEPAPGDTYPEVVVAWRLLRTLPEILYPEPPLSFVFETLRLVAINRLFSAFIAARWIRGWAFIKYVIVPSSVGSWPPLWGMLGDMAVWSSEGCGDVTERELRMEGDPYDDDEISGRGFVLGDKRTGSSIAGGATESGGVVGFNWLCVVDDPPPPPGAATLPLSAN